MVFAREQLEAFFPALIDTYGNVASTVMADWYEELFNEASALAEMTAAERANARMRWAIGKAFEGDPAQALATLKVVTDELVKQAGRETVILSSKRNGRRYARVPTGAETCAWCIMLASRGFVYESAGTAGEMAKYHGECVVPGTFVSGPEANVSMMRKFEGEVVTLSTAGGHHLTVTPNHPVLTRRGWVPAGLLREGDDLVRGPRVNRGVVSRPDEDHVPSRIEDVMRAMSVMLPSGGLSVPGSAEQFHGDGAFNSEVDVVDVRDLLRHEIHASLGEPSSELNLKVTAGSFAANGLVEDRGGASVLLTPADGAPSGGLVRGGDLCDSLRLRQAGSSELPSVAGSAYFDARLASPALNDFAGDAGRFGNGVEAFTLAVPTEGIGVNGDAAARLVPMGVKFDPTVAYADPDGFRVYAENGADLLARLAGFVEFDRLVNKRFGDYSGHVYNLSTTEGWYNANGITVSNCDCTITPEDGTVPDGYDPDALYEQYSAVHESGDSDKQVAAKMREQFDLS